MDSNGVIPAGFFESRHGLDEKLVSRILSEGLSRGGTYAEIFAQHKVSDRIGFEDGLVNRASASVDLGVGIRVLDGDRTGYAFTEELLEPALLNAARTAAAIASTGTSGGLTSFRAVGIESLYPPSPLWSVVPNDQKLDLVRGLGERIASKDPSVVKAAVHFGSYDDRVLIANSLGDWVEEQRPMCFMYASCTARKDGLLETNSFSRARRAGPEYFDERMVEHMADEAVARTMILFDARVPGAGEMPVVLAPATSGILLHEAMGHGFEADFNRKGTSIFSSMMGKKVAEDFVTIVDTGLVPGARGAVAVDDEGVPGRSTTLVENGVLTSYLHDRISAAHYGLEPTGNGRRESFRHAPLPRMRVTTMENGPHHPEEIIRSVKKGLYAGDFSNGEVAIGAGDYSFYVKSGFLIEDGRLTAPVKDVNLIGSGPETLARTVMVGDDKAVDEGTWTCGKDGQSVPVGLGLPTVKVSSITVGGVNR